MKPTLISIMLAFIVGVSGCKDKTKVYTDSQGRHFVLSESCVIGHNYQYTTISYVGKVPITTWHRGYKCDSIATDIVYIK